MKVIFATPFFTSIPKNGFENAVLRDYEDLKSKYQNVEVFCSESRDVDPSVELTQIKSRLVDRLKLFASNPLSMFLRLKHSGLCILLKKYLENGDLSYAHLNQPWLFYEKVTNPNVHLDVRFHNNDVEYLKILARLEKKFFKKLILLIEAKKLVYLLGRIRGPQYNFICYSDRDVIGLKPYLRSDIKIKAMPFSFNFPGVLKTPLSDSKLVFFGGGNRPNLESLLWLENEGCPYIEDKIDLYSSDVSLCSTFAKSKWINVMGYSKDIVGIYASPPIFIFPIFSGSGIKLKVVDAIETGCFVLTSEEGASGLDRSISNLIVLENFTPLSLMRSINKLRKSSGISS